MRRCVQLAAMAAGMAIQVLAVNSIAAAAETAAGESGGLEEIVVSAQRREQNIQEVGTSITAFDAGALQNLGLNSVTDVAAQVPGMQYQAFSPSITIFNLRGVSQNDFGDHHEAPVAVYTDDVYVASMGAVAGAIYDLDRVEVLRGPQGTLFGRNATGGLVHYISQKPTFDESGFVNADIGEYSPNDVPAYQLEGALNVPLNDVLATRFSFSADYHKGLIENQVGPDANSTNQYAGRWQLRWKAGESGEVLLKAYAVRNNQEISPSYAWGATCNTLGPQPGGAAACPGSYAGLGAFFGTGLNPYLTCPGCDESGYRNPSSDPFKQAFDRQGIFNRTVWGATTHASWNFGAVKLSSITDFMHLNKRYGEDSDGSPNYQFNFDTYQTYHQVSQEVHLSHDSGRFRWITGFYFLDLHNNDRQDEQVNQNYCGAYCLGFVVGHQGPKFTLDTRSEALFAQTEWDFVDQLTLITGARETFDQKKYDFVLWTGTTSNPLTDANGVPYVYNPTQNPGAANPNYNAFSYKVELDYKPARNVLFYASLNRGNKGGGWSAPSNMAIPYASFLNILAYKPETLTDTEVGEKLTFWNGRARLNADLFYYDYRNYQAFELVDFTQIIGNLHAHLKGGELDAAVTPINGLTLETGVSGLATRIKNVAMPDGTLLDRQMPNAPKWTVNALARYEWPAPRGNWLAQVDAKWNASQYLENINGPDDYQPSYAVVNLRLGYAADSHWEVAAYAKNVANKYYRVYSLDLSSLGYTESVYGLPRQVGVDVRYRWGR
jgi:iron complex outermembrane recepter protein